MTISTVNIITIENEDNPETSNFFLGYSMFIKQNKQQRKSQIYNIPEES